jgi:hypothetical protein
MSIRRVARSVTETAEESGAEKLDRLLAAPLSTAASLPASSLDGVRIGTLVGFADGGATPLVTFDNQPTSAAVPARATLDLHAGHVGKSAVLVFEGGDPLRPIVLGCLHVAGAGALAAAPEQVEIDADGQRLIVSAKDRIVLRCGKASLTLTKEGKVIVQGAYVSNQSTGVLRLKGGSVQIN